MKLLSDRNFFASKTVQNLWNWTKLSLSQLRTWRSARMPVGTRPAKRAKNVEYDEDADKMTDISVSPRPSPIRRHMHVTDYRDYLLERQQQITKKRRKWPICQTMNIRQSTPKQDPKRPQKETDIRCDKSTPPDCITDLQGHHTLTEYGDSSSSVDDQSWLEQASSVSTHNSCPSLGTINQCLIDLKLFTTKYFDTDQLQEPVGYAKMFSTCALSKNYFSSPNSSVLNFHQGFTTFREPTQYDTDELTAFIQQIKGEYRVQIFVP